MADVVTALHLDALVKEWLAGSAVSGDVVEGLIRTLREQLARAETPLTDEQVRRLEDAAAAALVAFWLDLPAGERAAPPPLSPMGLLCAALGFDPAVGDVRDLTTVVRSRRAVYGADEPATPARVAARECGFGGSLERAFVAGFQCRDVEVETERDRANAMRDVANYRRERILELLAQTPAPPNAPTLTGDGRLGAFDDIAFRAAQEIGAIEGATPAQHMARVHLAVLRAIHAAAVPEERVRHVKRGTTYGVLGAGELQSGAPAVEGAVLVAYRGEDGRLWFRPAQEFDDGRFAPVAAGRPEARGS